VKKRPPSKLYVWSVIALIIVLFTLLIRVLHRWVGLPDF